MNDFNKYITELFKLLVEHGHKYVSFCTHNSITFTKYEKTYTIRYEKRDYCQNEFHSLQPYAFNTCCEPEIKHEETDNIVFIVEVDNYKTYDVLPFNRVETAQYLEKLDNIKEYWEFRQITDAIASFTNDELNEEF